MPILASTLLVQEFIHNLGGESVRTRAAELYPGTAYEVVQTFEAELDGIRAPCSIVQANGHTYLAFTKGLENATKIPGDIF